MQDVYEHCPVWEDERYRLRLIVPQDAEDLLAVYSDRNALPFFNSDNCHGDNFYYPTIQRMREAVDFWVSAYQNRWFVRLTIFDKTAGKAVGSIELFHRDAEDSFKNTGVLRLDVGSGYEKEGEVFHIIGLVLPDVYDLFYCGRVITKAPIYAVERTAALQRLGFIRSEHRLVGNGGETYDGYWERAESV